MNLIRDQLQSGRIGVPEALRLTADKCHPEYRNLEWILRRAADAFEGKEDEASAAKTRAGFAEQLADDRPIKSAHSKLS